MLGNLDKCVYCGGKYQPPGSPLHVDYACDCAERDNLRLQRMLHSVERAEWKRVLNRKHRRTFVMGGK